MSDIQKHVSQVIAEFNAADLKISDNEQYVGYGSLLKKVSETIKAVDAAYAEDKASTYAVYKAVMDEINETKKPLEVAKAKIKSAMDGWNRHLREEAAKQQAAIAEQGEDADVPVKVVAETPQIAGVKTYTVWKYRITDREKIPSKYWVLDESAIAREVREMKGAASIPGVEAYSEQEVRG